MRVCFSRSEGRPRDKQHLHGRLSVDVLEIYSVDLRLELGNHPLTTRDTLRECFELTKDLSLLHAGFFRQLEGFPRRHKLTLTRTNRR
jgi:hypothetical protein